jgi:outer membrane protein assembly factor BamB
LNGGRGTALLRLALLRLALLTLAAALPVAAAGAGAGVARGASPADRPRPAAPAAPAPGDWPTYLHDPRRSAANGAETALSPATAPYLARRWAAAIGSAIVASPSIAGGVVYVGAADGYEYALDAATGTRLWQSFLGVTNAPGCDPPNMGIASAATVQDGVVYVGGGDAYWYALDAGTGAVLWKVFTGDNSGGSGHYNWSSPLLYNGFAYIGVSSLGDCPLVQGQLLRVSLATHAVVGTYDVVPNDQVGGGIWTSPAVDPATGTIFVTTGTQQFFRQPQVQAMVALDAATMSVKGWWSISPSRAVVDSDWGDTPTLFDDASGRHLVAAMNKDGYAYAFRRDDVGAGPVWNRLMAYGGTCPVCGDASVSSGAFDGTRLYLAGGNTTIAGGGFPGSVRALDPATGATVWEHGAAAPVVPALAYANGLVVDGAGSTLEVLAAATGTPLYDFPTGGPIYAAPSVAGGTIFVASTDGTVSALAPAAPIVPAADPGCPPGWTCQDVGGPSPAGGEVANGDRWSVSAGGSGIGGTADQFRLVSQGAGGSGRVVARLVAAPGGGAQAGVMVRQSNDPSSPYYAALAGAGGLSVQYRSGFGRPAGTLATVPVPALPIRLEIVRSGDRLQAAISRDGGRFTLVPGSTVVLPMPAAALEGVATTSRAPAATTATYTGVAVSGPGPSPAAVPPVTPCPDGWTCADVGNPAAVGDQSASGAPLTVQGSGVDGAGYADQLHYVWRSLAGDWTLSAAAGWQAGAGDAARAGIMVRQSASDPGSVFYSATVTPGGQLVVAYRQREGLRAASLATASVALPAAIQVARSGTTYCTYTSTGGGPWTYLPGTCLTLGTSGPVLAGPAVTSGARGGLAAATFAGVSVGSTAPPAPTICPSGWGCADVGFPVPRGSQSVSGGVWTVLGSGSDIWHAYDQFHFVWRALPADGTLSARVTSLGGNDSWAKAGVMVRQSADPSSPFYAVLVTPGNGISVQYRAARAAQAIRGPGLAGTAPARVRVARSADVFCASTSADGVTWTSLAGSCQTIGMAGGALAGLAVDSHNDAELNTTTFDSVSLAGDAPRARSTQRRPAWPPLAPAFG